MLLRTSVRLAASNPDKLKEMQDLFLEEAVKYNVLPLDDRVYGRFNAAIAGRLDLMGDRGLRGGRQRVHRQKSRQWRLS